MMMMDTAEASYLNACDNTHVCELVARRNEAIPVSALGAVEMSEGLMCDYDWLGTYYGSYYGDLYDDLDDIEKIDDSRL